MTALSDWGKNDHGVEGYWSSIGSCYERVTRLPDGTEKRERNARIFVPRCCTGCRDFDNGEPGEYGALLSGPYCMKNVWFPTRKGTCKWKNT